MKKYAQSRIAALLSKLSSEARRTAASPDADAVHDLRVTIRRLSRGLKAFSQFFPGKSWKRIRRELSGLMSCAADVRDRDVALELLQKAGVAQNARVAAALTNDRAAAAQTLQDALDDWRKRNAARQWKGALEL